MTDAPPPPQAIDYTGLRQQHQAVAAPPAFEFNGGAATYIGTALLGLLITAVTFGICYPFAVVLGQRWRAKHTLVEGRQLVFTGSAVGLFGRWIWWWLLSVVTLGIYLLWVVPRITRWKVEHQAFA